MIRSALLRLTMSYLAIIMALSIVFSFLLYRISTYEFDKELSRPGQHEVWQPVNIFDFDQFREIRISTSRTNLQQRLVVFNLGALVLGSLASYALARRTLKPIEQAMDAQNRFTADASHELRTPLTAMQSEIEVALRNKNLDKTEAKELLKSNLEEVAKLKNLSDSLLRLARRDEPHLKPIAVKATIDEAIKQVASLASVRNIKLVNQSAAFKVLGDQKSLKDTLVTLLDNAIKYSQPKQTVIINGIRTDGHGLISVEDKGLGINASDLPHIFERFYRADQSRSKNQVDGHGLGLSIAKQNIESIKGELNVASKLGEGSVFTIKLPAK